MCLESQQSLHKRLAISNIRTWRSTHLGNFFANIKRSASLSACSSRRSDRPRSEHYLLHRKVVHLHHLSERKKKARVSKIPQDSKIPTSKFEF
jgi:hypothetical protein